MEQLDINQVQYGLLRQIYKMRPFDIKGDLKSGLKEHGPQLLSCLILASNRPKDLNLLLEDLSFQTLAREKFEIVILNDGAGETIRKIIDNYKKRLNIIYKENAVPHRVISDLRNTTLEMSEGQVILFLDDDTRVFQKDFLQRSLELIGQYKADIILVNGQPLFGLVKQKYCYLNQYSFSTRCCLFRREILIDCGGFRNGLNSYEDIELSIRLMINKFRVYKANELTYYHPPLYFDSMRKPLSAGHSIFQLKPHYSLLFWLLVYFNALRFLPYGISPDKNHHQWFKISLGILIYPFTRRSSYYYA